MPFAMRLAGLVMCLVVSACAQTRRPTTADEFHGLYEVGIEVNHFRPCAKRDGLAYPVQLGAVAWPANVPEGAPGAFNSTVYYVRWRGTLDPGVRVPLGSPPVPRWFRVTEFLEARTPRRGECGWTPAG
jgi:hypothetical protein